MAECLQPPASPEQPSKNAARFLLGSLLAALCAAPFLCGAAANAQQAGSWSQVAIYDQPDRQPGLNQDGSGTPLAFEQGQMDGGGDPSPQPLAPVLEREYVWGPGEHGVDELLVQYDAGRNPWWVVQDGGGDVVALCDLGGGGGDARVVAQWTYDAYGAALSADHLHAHAYIHCGHKALFADRLDVGVAIGADALEGGIHPDLIAARKVLGYVALGAVAVSIGKLAYSAATTAVQYVMKYGMRGALRNLWNGGVGLAKRAWERLRKPKVAGACGCFVGGR